MKQILKSKKTSDNFHKKLVLSMVQLNTIKGGLVGIIDDIAG